MTTRFTQEEWLQVIEEAEKALPTSFTQYKAPLLGSKEFSRRIDHTLLKVDATKEQIDQLCQEALRDGFHVGYFFQLRRCSAGCSVPFRSVA